MKKLLFIFLMLCSAFTKAQSTLDTLTEINGEVAYREDITAPNSTQSIIYYSAKTWLEHSGKSINATLISQDNVSGKLVANCSFMLDNQNGTSITYNFKLEVACTNAQYTIRIYNIMYTPTGSGYRPSPIDRFNDSLKRLLDLDIHQTAYTLNDKFNQIMFSTIKGINNSANSF